MRRFGRIALLLAVVAVLGGPASAGTQQQPEMTDECSGYVHAVDGSTRVRHASLDLCKGWFTAGPSAAGAPAFRVTLEVGAEPVDGVEAAYMSFWSAGNCRYGVTVDGAVNAPHPQAFSADCEPPGEATCTVPQLELNCTYEDTTQYYDLAADSVVWDGKQLQVTVVFEGGLAAFAGDHSDVSAVTDPLAVSVQTFGPVYGWTAGCTSNFPSDRCFEVNGDWMFATGRR